MAWFFTNPILKRIEDALWQKAESEINARVKSGQLQPDKVPQEVKSFFKALFSKQRRVAKLALKRYKEIAEKQAAEALALTLGDSAPDWYSIEEAWSTGVPVILAVPVRLVRGHVEFRFASLLPPQIEFADLLPEVHAEFAREAVASHFASVLKRAIKDRVEFNAKGFYPYDIRVADLLPKDYYYLGDEQSVSREDMLIINTTATRDAWEKKYRLDMSKRPQKRRYSNISEAKWMKLA